MDQATLDLTLAIIHHLAVFGLFGVLVGELLLVRGEMSASDVRRVAGIDLWYGVLAVVIVVVGFSRAIFAAKGWDYYLHEPFFHAKLGVFLVIGLLSIAPTIQFIKWRGALKKDATALPTDAQVASVRRLVLAEVVLFALLPVFAAAMARGVGAMS